MSFNKVILQKDSTYVYVTCPHQTQHSLIISFNIKFILHGNTTLRFQAFPNKDKYNKTHYAPHREMKKNHSSCFTAIIHTHAFI